MTPVLTFTHAQTGGPFCTAIIGGYVLHDPSLGGDYGGRYLYGYFCATQTTGLSGELLTTNILAAQPQPRDEGIGVGFGLSSFGLDACGHPYAMNVQSGGLWRIEGSTPGACGEYKPPQTTLTSAPSGVLHSSSASVAFSSDVAGSSFSCALDGAPATPCVSPDTLTKLADGPHTLAVRAADQAGNVDATAAVAAWIADTGAPVVTIVSGPATGLLTSASVAFTTSESDVVAACSLDGALPSPCTSPATFADLAAGPHTLSVTATDAAGNQPAPAAISWSVVAASVLAPLTVAPLPASPAPPAPSAMSIAIAPTRMLTVGAHWHTRVVLSAVAQSGTATVTLRVKARVLGRRAGVRLRAGQPLSVSIALSKAGIRYLSAHRRAHVQVVVSLVNGDGQAAHIAVTLRLRLPPAHTRKHARHRPGRRAD